MKTLKKILLASFTMLMLLSFTAQKGNHVGKWRGQDKGDIGSLTLSTDGYATFEFNGRIMGGKSFNHKGEKASMKYTINTGVTPNTIDFMIIHNKSKKELSRLRGILKMKSRNKMQMALQFGGGSGRPSDFSKDAIVFDRVK